VQSRVVGELLLGDREFFAAGLDRQAEGGLKGWGGAMPASLLSQGVSVYDIRVDLACDIPVESPADDIPVEGTVQARRRHPLGVAAPAWLLSGRKERGTWRQGGHGNRDG
jgi:hypothetical protein